MPCLFKFFCSIQKKLTLRALCTLVLLFCSITLSIVYYLEYFEGITGCPLCYQQRLPYFISGVIALIGLIVSCQTSHLRTSPWVLPLFLILFILSALISITLSLYHSGIELNWWQGSSSCSVTSTAFLNTTQLTLEEQIAALQNTPLVRCDVPSALYLNLSLANWNFFTSFFCLILLLSLTAVYYCRRATPPHS